MSIVYGHFSQAIKSQAKSGVIASGTSFYFTVPWPVAGYIDRVKVYIGSSQSSVDLYVLNNGAHVRDNSALTEYYVYGATTTSVKADSNYTAYFDFNQPLFVSDQYARGYVYFRVVLQSASTGPLTLVVDGRKGYPSEYTLSDTTGIQNDRGYRVLMGKGQSGSGGTGGTIYDMTGFAKGVGGDPGTLSNFSFSASTDYVYVGGETKIDHWEFVIGTGSTNSTALSAQYWNGSDWTTFRLLDNTAAIGGSSMRFSGIVEGAGLGSSAWLPVKFDASVNAKLPADPLTIYENQVLAGTAKPITFMYNPSRYWVRFNLTGNSDIVNIQRLNPIAEQYIL